MTERPSDELSTSSGNWTEIEEVSHDGEITTVYNMTVKNWHTYFIGTPTWNFDVWVHNNHAGRGSGTTTPHTVVQGGNKTAGAPKTGRPNSIHEQTRPNGSRSVTYYDEQGRAFSREDYGQLRTHGKLGRGPDGNSVPHEHRINYSDKGPIGKQYRELDINGRPVGPWYND